MNQHWRSYEQICPCEVDYDFIGHFENLGEEAPHLLRAIGVDHYVTFPDYHPSRSKPYLLEYFSQLSKEEIFKLGKFYELDFKLFGYDFPGPLKEFVAKNDWELLRVHVLFWIWLYTPRTNLPQRRIKTITISQN